MKQVKRLFNFISLNPKSHSRIQIILFPPHTTQTPIHLRKAVLIKVGVFALLGMKENISFPSL